MAQLYLQDKRASLNEYNVGVALDQLKINYAFQYFPFGSGDRGDFVVDFVLYMPFARPLEVNGEYWHLGQLGDGDILRNQIIADYFKVAEVLIVWGRDSETVEKAKATLRKIL